MFLKNKIFSLTLLSTLLMTGCVSNPSWSGEQKSKLSTLRIDAVTIDSNAYGNPNAKDSRLFLNNEEGLSASGNNGGGGLVSFALLAIDGAVVAVQQTKYNSKNSQYYEAVKNKITAQSETQLSTKIEDVVKSNPFFSDKITADSKNILKINVNKHGLERTANTNVENMKMIYGIKAYASLVSQEGEELLGKTYIGKSSTTATMSELIADDYSVLNKMKNEAQQSFASALKYGLLTKTTTQAEREASRLAAKNLYEKNKAMQKVKAESTQNPASPDTVKP